MGKGWIIVFLAVVIITRSWTNGGCWIFNSTLNLRTSCIYRFGWPRSKKSRARSLMTVEKLQSIFILFCSGESFFDPFSTTSLGNVTWSDILGSMFSSNLKFSSGFSLFLKALSLFLCSRMVSHFNMKLL